MKTKVVIATLLAILLAPIASASPVNAATSGDSAAVNLSVASTISISAPSDVNLGTITGTGSSSVGSASWTISTNNSAGYKMEWQASADNMTSGANSISAYTPASADTPETWSVAASASEWGARLKSSSTDTDSEWGTDDTSEKWLNVDSSAPREIVSRSSETASSTQTIAFKAEVGSSKVQPTGAYSVNITVTVTTL